MKINKILLLVILILAIMIIPNVAQAETSKVKIESIRVVSPESGNYVTGQKIKIEVLFSGNLQEGQMAPTLSLTFGTYGRVSINEATLNGKKITYEYTIKESDCGELSYKSISGFLLDDNGNEVDCSFTGTLSGSAIKANPLIWTDVSKANVYIDKIRDGWRANTYLKIEGITELKNHTYLWYITYNNTEPTLKIDRYNKIDESEGEYIKSAVGDGHSFDSYFEKNGDLYFWLYEEQKNNETGNYEHKILIKGQKLKRPEQEKLGNRINASFWWDKTVALIVEPMELSTNEDRKVNVKIGKVTDNAILTSIKNGESDALSKLMAYAKSASPLYTGKVSVGTSESIIGKLNIINGAYYYAYVELDDEGGKYYPIEDISLYQGKIDEVDGRTYLKDTIDWEWLVEEPASTPQTPTEPIPTQPTTNSDSTTATIQYPFAGISPILVISIAIIAVIAIILKWKILKYKDIK